MAQTQIPIKRRLVVHEHFPFDSACQAFLFVYVVIISHGLEPTITRRAHDAFWRTRLKAFEGTELEGLKFINSFVDTDLWFIERKRLDELLDTRILLCVNKITRVILLYKFSILQKQNRVRHFSREF